MIANLLTPMTSRSCLVACLLFLLAATAGHAEQELTLARGRVVVSTPEAWSQVETQSPILESELSVAPPEGTEAAPGRLTMMAAGGSVDQNIQRWVAQFQEGDGGADLTAAKITTQPLGETEITLLDIEGVFMEGPPRGPKMAREDYRMLGAIVPLSPGRAYFFKLVGPKATIDPAAEGFQAMIESVVVR